MYTVKDIERIFNISPKTAYLLINEDTFPKITINKQHYIPKSQLDKWIERNTFKSKI